MLQNASEITNNEKMGLTIDFIIDSLMLKSTYGE